MENLLKVSGLNKSFGRKQVLHGVDFTVASGRVVGLVGPNGAGKSTIMKAILGLIPADAGQIAIAGVAVAITSHQALKHVGALIEYPGIYPFLTGRQHLQLFAAKRQRQTHIDEVVTDLGMGDYIDKSAKSYSLGMKQKLGIAQALVDHPQLVILDEPMNGLDPQAVKELREIIRRQAQAGVSFLISSHILSELEKVADDVLILDHGHIVQQSTMAALINSGGVVYVIKTTDDSAAKQALAAAHVPLADTTAVRVPITDSVVLNQALMALVKAGIAVQDVTKAQHDLERSFLDMIAKDKEAR
ncbi:ABC transporter ATP-binding protein [Lacticaseibacillus baoqingensis]|uniref:ABC transporter ATP-binding protein n=1 Tax=Lacticaseibacillus baoqingensis TaxID=2486013 RepID=A0ABW4E9C9_9LACO